MGARQQSNFPDLVATISAATGEPLATLNWRVRRLREAGLIGGGEDTTATIDDAVAILLAIMLPHSTPEAVRIVPDLLDLPLVSIVFSSWDGQAGVNWGADQGTADAVPKRLGDFLRHMIERWPEQVTAINPTRLCVSSGRGTGFVCLEFNSIDDPRSSGSIGFGLGLIHPPVGEPPARLDRGAHIPATPIFETLFNFFAVHRPQSVAALGADAMTA